MPSPEIGFGVNEPPPLFAPQQTVSALQPQNLAKYLAKS